VLLELFGHALGDEMDRKATGVGGDDGAGLAELGDAREELTLDFEIFGDDFDDPVGFRDAGEVIFELPMEIFSANAGVKNAAGRDFWRRRCQRGRFCCGRRPGRRP